MDTSNLLTHLSPHDVGPIYAETLMGRFPVEPFNTASNLIFLFIVIYFSIRTRLSYQKFPFLLTCLPILFIGYIGGTVFHATRSHTAWLIMDFVPIFILAFGAAMFFWLKIIPSYIYATCATLTPIIIGGALRSLLPLERAMKIGIGYSFMAITILLPAFLVAYRNTWRGGKLLIMAIVSFSLAVSFRQLDEVLIHYFPMGTHFLWHIFGGIATWCVMNFVYLVEEKTNK